MYRLAKSSDYLRAKTCVYLYLLKLLIEYLFKFSLSSKRYSYSYVFFDYCSAFFIFCF